MSSEEFFRRAMETHEGFYDYSNSVFLGMKEKVSIGCPVHGTFSTLAGKHIQERRGCPSCGRDRAKFSQRVMHQDFFDLAVEKHGYYYDYSDVSLQFFQDDIWVTCPEHGPFQVTASGHIQGRGCPGCRPQGSCPENELSDFIESLGFSVVRNSRKIIAPLELDIVVPDLQVAFEFNGIFWHSEQAGKSPDYHRKKTDAAMGKGYRLFHVYESEWDLNREGVKARISDVLMRKPSKDLSKAYFIHEYNDDYSLVLGSDTICSFRVRDGVAVDVWSPHGIQPVRRLMELSGVSQLKHSLDWPEFTTQDFVQAGFSKLRNVRPERLYFDKKTRRRLKGKPSVEGTSFSVVDSGSTIWVVDHGVSDD